MKRSGLVVLVAVIGCVVGAPASGRMLPRQAAGEAYPVEDRFPPDPVVCRSARDVPVAKAFRKAVIVFVRPTDAQLEEWRASFRSEDDFHVMADDHNWYRSEAFDFLERQRHATVVFRELGPLEFVVGDEVWCYDFEDRPYLDAVVVYRPNAEPEEVGSYLDVIVAYRPGVEPLFVPPIAVHRLAEYFSPDIQGSGPGAHGDGNSPGAAALDHTRVLTEVRLGPRVYGRQVTDWPLWRAR